MTDRRTVTTDRRTVTTSRRGQTAVVGVALLLAITVLSLAALTATIGTVVEDSSRAAETGRVVRGFDAALDPHAGTPHERRIAVSSGQFRTVPRTVRLVGGRQTLAAWRTDALVYGEYSARVAYLGGAVITGSPGNANLRVDPPVAASDGRLFVGLPTLGTDGVTGFAPGSSGAVLRTNVTHDRRTFSNHVGYGLAVETATPGVWEQFFAERGASTARRAFDDDGVVSVVARFPAADEASVTVHDLGLVIRRV
ncbi:MAG: hypothetical protein ABEJ78_06365 [Haloferacaceae archaeon]